MFLKFCAWCCAWMNECTAAHRRSSFTLLPAISASAVFVPIYSNTQFTSITNEISRKLNNWFDQWHIVACSRATHQIQMGNCSLFRIQFFIIVVLSHFILCAVVVVGFGSESAAEAAPDQERRKHQNEETLWTKYNRISAPIRWIIIKINL